MVGDPGQKDKLGYQALMSQIEAGLAKGYSDKEVVSVVVRAVQPGLQLRSYLENMVELTLPKLRKILRFHFHEKNATELYQLLTNLAQEPKEDPQSFLMRALAIRQKIISASKESGSGIKYDASSVQSLFLHSLETGLADETIRATIRPLTQNPSVADEDLIEAMSFAMSAETERRHNFGLSSKTKPVKVSTVEEGVDARGKKNQELLATLKAVQADLATVQSEVKTLRSTVTASSKPPTGFNHNGNRVEPRQVGCRVCREKGEGDKCSHCYLCGGLNHIARYCRTKFNNQQGNGRRLPPRDREYCANCLKFASCTELRRCSSCQSVLYCSVDCQKNHRPRHKVLCKAIKELSERTHNTEKGLGDAQDMSVFSSHMTPKQQDYVAKLVGRVFCAVLLNDKLMEVLWDTGAQVSLISEDVLKSQLPSVQVRDISQLLDTQGSISLQAANGTDIPYCGWAEIDLELAADTETKSAIPSDQGEH